MPDTKNSLNITLAEPIVFLRSSDPSGRLQTEPNKTPTLLRGVLTLNVIKPIEISRIEVELVGLLTVTFPTEGESYQLVFPKGLGVGPYRADAPETRKLYSSSITVFRAGQLAHHRSRPPSVGPGSPSPNSNEVREHAGIAFSRPPSTRRRSERQSSHGIPLDFDPTPPYTPAPQSPSTIESSFGIPEQHPNSRFEGLPRQAPPVSSRPNSITIPVAHHAAYSNASSNTNISFDRESDNRSNEMPHVSLPYEGDISSHITAEDLPLRIHHRTSPGRRSSVHSPEFIHPTQLRARGSSCDGSNALASHSRLRLSLNSVLDAVAEMAATRSPSWSRSTAEDMERGRTRDRISREHRFEDPTLQTDEGVAGTSGNVDLRGINTSHPNIHAEHRDHHFLGLGRFFGFDHDRGENNAAHIPKEHGDNERVFKPGTYSYPISFLVRPNLPPTFSVPHGSMDYYIKGVAHRPGAFTSKLSSKVPVLVVAIGDGEDAGTGDPGPISIERQWEGRLAYSFGLSSRLFLLGSQRHPEATGASIHSDAQSLAGSEAGIRTELTYGTAMVDLSLLPTEKVKIWKLSALVEQRIKYMGEGGLPLRADDHRQVKLLEVTDECSTEEMNSVDEEELQTYKDKNKNKHQPVQIPLLPSPLPPHRSPLLRYLSPSSDPSVLIGPGPYALSFILALPGCNGLSPNDNGLYFTMKQKITGVRVEHTLKFIMRLEQPGDLDDMHDHEEKARKKYFDLSVQAPITVLSCRCDPDFQTLPSYSQTMEDDLLDHTACPCQPGTAGLTDEHGHQGEHEFESPPLQGQGQGHAHVASTMLTPTSASSSFNEGTEGVVDNHSYFHHRHRSSLDEHQYDSHPVTMSPGPPSPASWAHEAGPSAGPGPSMLGGAYGHSLHIPSPTSRSQSRAHARVQSHTHPHTSSHPHTPPVLTPHSSRPPSPLARYERLVSGLESEAGEAPPSYNSIAASGV